MPAWWRSSCGSPCCDGSVFTKNKNAGLTSSVFSATIHLAFAGVAHLVERDLAKVEVASSSLVARSKKERHPHGCLSFLEQHFCYAKVVACGRVTEREWGNPSKVPPSHSPFLAVGGSADNKTCGQSHKKRTTHSATPDRGTLKRVLGLGRQCNCTVCLFCCLSA